MKTSTLSMMTMMNIVDYFFFYSKQEKREREINFKKIEGCLCSHFSLPLRGSRSVSFHQTMTFLSILLSLSLSLPIYYIIPCSYHVPSISHGRRNEAVPKIAVLLRFFFFSMKRKDEGQAEVFLVILF
jgi:hypothetical protein